jgi:hypothetical protein
MKRPSALNFYLKETQIFDFNPFKLIAKGQVLFFQNVGHVEIVVFYSLALCLI